MTENFYRSFEDKFRGSREEIVERYKIYLPFILPLKEIYPDGEVLDIGCGRGEWLELLKKNSIVAQGIDLDEGMLKACNENNLNALKGDGFAHLKTLKDESLTTISAFHIVEHIPFETLQSFVSEAHRVLKPGGLLIIETPNPENIQVGTELFYLDPTHLKPIPSTLLSFVVDFYGFERSKVLRLQESKSLVNQENIGLFEVIRGASPDYSVVAQKKADDELLKLFEGIFSQNIGLPLTALTNKFENRLHMSEAKAEQIEAKAEQIEAKAEQAAVKAEQAAVKAEQAAVKAEQIEAKAEQIAATKAEQIAATKAEQIAATKAEQIAATKAEQLHTQLNSVYTSRSWKLTRPLRWVMFQLRLIKQYGLFLRIKSLAKKLVLHFLNRWPSLKLKLKHLINHDDPNIAQNLTRHNSLVRYPTPRSITIYSDIKIAIKKYKDIK